VQSSEEKSSLRQNQSLFVSMVRLTSFCTNGDILYCNFSQHSRFEGVASSIPKYFVTPTFSQFEHSVPGRECVEVSVVDGVSVSNCL
jgi:hypothetical protein